ncbi:MAG: hypothetical protein MUF62_05350 [Chitinophagaceae bacterium]|nr:hypothetical protein [Chitinophagaceae bacterium]
MDIQVLKSAIIKQIDQLQSEEALREVDRFLHAIAAGHSSQAATANQEAATGKADEVFAKAVEKYHTLLQKLAQ